jgi:SAM-dependent methyltransferase
VSNPDLSPGLSEDTSSDTPLPSPFDAMAAGYDAGFTHSRIGTLMRQAVTRRLDARFQPGDCVLELNCGTGEDALHLARCGIDVLATDASAAMVEIARAKAVQAGLTHRLHTRQMPIEEMGNIKNIKNFGNTGNTAARVPLSGTAAQFDGVLSNFGGLNCVEELRPVARAMAQVLRPDRSALLCLMGPICVWEWAWYLGHRRPGKAFRRLQPGGTRWRGLRIRYPSPRALCRAFAPYFTCERVTAIGALLPPTYAEEWAARHPRLLAGLNAWERRVETCPLAANLADHYLVELRRTTRID